MMARAAQTHDGAAANDSYTTLRRCFASFLRPQRFIALDTDTDTVSCALSRVQTRARGLALPPSKKFLLSQRPGACGARVAAARKTSAVAGHAQSVDEEPFPRSGPRLSNYYPHEIDSSGPRVALMPCDLREVGTSEPPDRKRAL